MFVDQIKTDHSEIHRIKPLLIKNADTIRAKRIDPDQTAPLILICTV